MKDPLIGMQLANFKVERLLGQGGMAMVYYGQDVKLHRPVAIKVLDKRYKNHPAYASRFVNEARMMANWHHENIIQIYYADDAQGFPYYVMEYVDGQDLEAVMELYQDERKLMPVSDVLRVGKAVASALDYAHQKGVIHRDVKPSNILLSKDGRVLLGDFGMALEVRDGSMGNIFGTPHYISPEQAKRSADAVPQSDIYSLGVILYEILTGSVPFNDPSPANIALQHISQKPPAPRSLNPDLPLATEQVLLKALEKGVKERYQTGMKFMEALEDSLTASGSSKKGSLPPLPVGVPTIQRSELSIEQISKRPAPKQAAPQRAVEMPATVRASAPPARRRYWLPILFLLVIGFGGLYFLRDRLNLQALLPSQTATTTAAAPQPTLTPVPPTETQAPSPTAKATSTVEDVSTAITATLAMPTETIQLPTSTPMNVPTIDVDAAPTVLYPEGNQYFLFYNTTSFFIYNNSYDRRSISGFTFQRLDGEGLPAEDIFQGYQWETTTVKYLPRHFCANITIFGDQNPPYLNPEECQRYGMIKTIQPRFDRPGDILFWTPKADSKQFRVLWLDEEIARCDIDASVCEIFIP
ncbi:MAG: serine/threonine protein kinase [Anaerolineales bacterium]|nr:serine/threonine protein kinase [Anaerolineales bacterium]